MSLLAIPILYPAGNISVINAYHFGVSACTESGLNTSVHPLLRAVYGPTQLTRNSVDLKELKTYQQLYLYFGPIVTNLGFINIMVVVVRLWWFRKHLMKLGIVFTAHHYVHYRAQRRGGREPAFANLLGSTSIV